MERLEPMIGVPGDDARDARNAPPVQSEMRNAAREHSSSKLYAKSARIFVLIHARVVVFPHRF